MFGKLKGKLKSIFDKNDEIIEEGNDDILNEDFEINKDDGVNIENDKKEGEFEGIEKKEEIEELGEKEDLNENEEFIKEEKDDEMKETPEKKGFFKNLFSKNKDDDLELDEKNEINLNNEEIEDELNEKEDINKIEENSNKDNIKEEKDNNQDNLNSIELNENKDNNEEIEDKEDSNEKKGFFSKTINKLKSKKINEEDFDKIWVELEIYLLEINIAFEIVEKIENQLREVLIGNSFDRFNLNNKIREVLVKEIEVILKDREGDLLNEIKRIKDEEGLVKIIILGVNGTGKTTSIAKFVNYLQKNNISLVVAASDTFRAAAIEQLEEHSKKLNFKLISHKGGSDPAAVAFDAIEHAKAKNLDVVLIDTAGRMPNNSNLMAELQKIKRVSESQLTIFIGDSISGNDLIEQINLFDKGVKIDGVILTKVDTDERPGSIVTCAYSIDKSIYFLGIGQEYDDLIKFDAELIADKLFEVEE